MNKQWLVLFVLIIFLSGLLHYKNFSTDLVGKHAWRQTQTQATIISFYEEDMNILNPRQDVRYNTPGIYRMEFPLMQWLVAVSYKLFGAKILVTRIWMFVIGLFTIAGMHKLLLSIYKNEMLAMMGAWAFCWSPEFFYYTINPLPDNMALCFAIWGIAFFFEWFRRQETTALLLAGLLLSTGALCKLPFILYFIVPLVYFITFIKNNGLSKKTAINFFLAFVFVLLPVAWYAWVVSGWQENGIVQGVLKSEASMATLLGYLWYHFYSTLPELLLNYASVPFFIAAFYFLARRRSIAAKHAALFIAWWLAVAGYVVFEINMIQRVHDYYLFPFLPLLFLLVGYGAYRLYQQKNTGKYLALVLLAVLPLTAYLRSGNGWDENDPGFNKDLIIYKDDLQKAVPDNALCVAGNDKDQHVFLYYIHKKGWIFNNDNYDSLKLDKAIREGAQYLYSDSRKFDESRNVLPLLDSLLMQKGNIKVFRLRRPT